MATTRRHFLGAAGGAALAGEMQAQSQGSVSPNDRVRVALIGNGIQGPATPTHPLRQKPWKSSRSATSTKAG